MCLPKWWPQNKVLLYSIVLWEFVWQECIPVGCVPPAHWLHLVVSAGGCACRGVHAWGVACVLGWHACPGGMCACPGGHECPGGMPCMPPVDRFLDTRLWKHYLPATTVAGGKYVTAGQCTVSASVYSCPSHYILLQILAQIFSLPLNQCLPHYNLNAHILMEPGKELRIILFLRDEYLRQFFGIKLMRLRVSHLSRTNFRSDRCKNLKQIYLRCNLSM